MSEVVVVASSETAAATALARRLAAQGARVAVLAASRKMLPEIARTLTKAGSPSVMAIPCDLTNSTEVAAAAFQIEHELGPIDRWLNTEMTDLRFVTATRVALDFMHARGRGTIVQVSAPETVRLFTDALRTELRIAGSGIHLENVRGYPFRKYGAASLAAAGALGMVLLKRLVR